MAKSPANHTKVSVLTPAGRGAIAVVAVKGPRALEAVQRNFFPSSKRPFADRKAGAPMYGRWGSESGEDVVLCRRTSDQIEIHCHGGEAAPARIVDDLKAAGASEEPWQRFVQRKERSRISAAARIAIADCTTQRSSAILLDQYHGALENSILGAAQHLEHTSTDRLNDEHVAAAKSAVARLLELAPLGLHLTRPWQVVIAGPPNVGKSSLINALLGYRRAIVFDQPGTTRDVLTAQTAFDGWPVELSDTAGLRSSCDPLESAGVARAMTTAAAADLLLLVFDLSQPLPSDFRRLSDQWPAALRVGNKCDLPPIDGSIEFPALKTSAVTGEGIEGLITAIVGRLPTAPQPGEAVPFTAEQIEQLSTVERLINVGEFQAARKGLLAMLA